MISQPPRPDTVNRLVEAALTGMSTSVDDATGAEVFSAYLTLTARAIAVAKEMGIELQPFRSALEKIYATVATPPQQVN